MKKSEIQALHQKTMVELRQLMEEVKKELTKAKLELQANRLEDTSKPYHLRKKLARIKTILREKELAEEAKQKILEIKQQTAADDPAEAEEANTKKTQSK